MGEVARPYRPSNGTEGELFYNDWCARCTREQGARNCRILTATLIYAADDADYPKEWIQDAKGWPGNPRCTAFRDRTLVVLPSIIRDRRQIGLPL